MRDRNGLTEEEFLKSYKPGDYPRPSLTVDNVIFTVTEGEEDNYRKLPEKELRVLLVKRGGHPCLGKWALPGGFVEPDENTKEAAERELMEETGLEHIYLEELRTFSDPGRDPRTWIVSCAYMALADYSSVHVTAGDDAASAAWFRLTYRLTDQQSVREEKRVVIEQRYELKLVYESVCLTAEIGRTVTKTLSGSFTEYSIIKNDGLAFDHAKILAYAMERLRKQVKNTDIALNLLPELFTMTELQQVYEVILDKPLLKAAFRRKLSYAVEETEQSARQKGHRPSKLYRRKLTECI